MQGHDRAHPHPRMASALSIIDADGLPPTGNAGNVLRPGTAVSLYRSAPADGRSKSCRKN